MLTFRRIIHKWWDCGRVLSLLLSDYLLSHISSESLTYCCLFSSKLQDKTVVVGFLHPNTCPDFTHLSKYILSRILQHLSMYPQLLPIQTQLIKLLDKICPNFHHLHLLPSWRRYFCNPLGISMSSSRVLPFRSPQFCRDLSDRSSCSHQNWYAH